MRAFIALSIGLMLAIPFASACQKEEGNKTTSPGGSKATETGQAAGQPAAGQPVAASQPAGGISWPRFRGADPGSPAANAGDPPVEINVEKNTLYQANVPVPGKSSPIIWGDRIYLTGEDDHIMAFDRAKGDLLWDVQLKAEPAATQPAAEGGGGMGGEGEINADTGTAAPSATTDGHRVYASFGSGVIGCVDRNGKQVWSHRLTPGLPKNTYGMASSPLIYGDVVIQQVDQGNNPDAGLSFVVAYRTADGAEAWRTQSRAVVSSWSSPVLATLPEGDTLITSSAPLVIAYNPKTGAERWECDGLGGEVAASPIVCGGVVIAPSNYSGGSLLAVKPGGKGDVSKSHLAWTTDSPAPDFPSPCGDGKKCYYLNGSMLLAINAADGKEAWKLELDGSFYASPVFAAGRIYAINRSGTMFVVSARGTKLAENKLDTGVDSSPAIVDGKIYVRTHGELWCIGRAAGAAAAAATAPAH